jgi:hypothetical protein
VALKSLAPFNLARAGYFESFGGSPFAFNLWHFHSLLKDRAVGRNQSLIDGEGFGRSAVPTSAPAALPGSFLPFWAKRRAWQHPVPEPEHRLTFPAQALDG